MIQLSRGKQGDVLTGNDFYVNIYDAYANKNNIQYRPIITLTSQETGNSVNLNQVQVIQIMLQLIKNAMLKCK